MKKLFTLIAVAAMALSANAQKITFGDAAIASANLPTSFGESGFTLAIVDEANKMAIDLNNAYFGDATSQEKFGSRLKSGGKSQVKTGQSNGMTLTVPSAGLLKIYVRSGNKDATDRNLVLTQGGTELYNQVVKDADAVSVDIEAAKSETNPTGTTSVYPVISVSVAAGTIDVAYPVNSINFYAFEFVAGEGGGEQGGGEQGGGEQGGGEQGATTALIDYPTSQTGITISGTTSWDNSQKYHGNADDVKNISFANGYTTEGVINDNWAELSVDGGFKAGDKISVAGYFNNNDGTKQAAVSIFIGEKGETATVLWKSDLFINGRSEAADPAVQTYTLEADYPTLKMGRADGLTGATRTNVTLVKVERNTSGISQVRDLKVKENGAIYNMAGQKVDASYKGVVIKNGKKMINK